jgi:hypothetical protein
MKKFKHIKEYNEFTINDLLDKGIDNLSPKELDILKNQGEISNNKNFYEEHFNFDVDKVEDFGDEIKVTGSLEYHNETYFGWFTLSKGEQQGKNAWDFFQGDMVFDPDPDDLYELDSMIQEIEFEYL